MPLVSMKTVHRPKQKCTYIYIYIPFLASHIIHAMVLMPTLVTTLQAPLLKHVNDHKHIQTRSIDANRPQFAPFSPLSFNAFISAHFFTIAMPRKRNAVVVGAPSARR